MAKKIKTVNTLSIMAPSKDTDPSSAVFQVADPDNRILEKKLTFNQAVQYCQQYQRFRPHRRMLQGPLVSPFVIV